ncbi:MAG: ATPase [Treponema sp.]|jgi:vacuolar-type H+-ATPase subunit H|nr:ATPase [Treponema sp.]
MEELRSTEVLDQEILEDARKKAYRILKSADDTVKAQVAVWDQKAEAAIADIREKYAHRTTTTSVEIMARLPLDKRRARSEKIEGLLKSAMKGYLSTLPRAKLLVFLETELRKRFDELQEVAPGSLEPDPAGDSPAVLPQVMFRGLSTTEVATILNKVFSREGEAVPWTLKPADPHFLDAGQFPEIRIDTRQVRITASIDRTADALLEDKRMELVLALLGPEGLDEGEGAPEGVSPGSNHD